MEKIMDKTYPQYGSTFVLCSHFKWHLSQYYTMSCYYLWNVRHSNDVGFVFVNLLSGVIESFKT